MKREVIGLTAAAVLALGAAAAQALPPCNPATNPNCEPPPPPPSGGACPSITALPPSGPSVSYSCQFTITDAYGRPAAGVPGSMEARWCNKSGSKVRATASDVSDASGRLSISVFSRPANVIDCHLDPGGEPRFSGKPSAVRKQATALPNHTVVVVPGPLQVQPVPTDTRALAGLDPGAGRMDLYQSGPYDKVLLIAEPFDQFEHSFGNRERRGYWRQFRQLLVPLFKSGWDVWMVQPHDTGESLHEQAAELAQAIAAARAALPAQVNCSSPTVAVLGFNTGGLVARIATARWEADPAWRARLGLPELLPVKFLATYDAPHYGMHINLDLQKALFDSQSADEITRNTNLDSCAASQFLRGRFDALRGQKTNEDFLAFFVRGAPVRVFSKKDNTEHECAAGPAVATLNAARGVPGWPAGVVRLGFTQSPGAPATKCFTDTARNLNANGQDLCKFVHEIADPGQAFAPTAGQVWLRFFADDPGLPDVFRDQHLETEDRVEWSDIGPGSRNPFFLDGFVTTVTKVPPPGVPLPPAFIEVFAHQRFPTTLVPFASAAAIQGPANGSPYESIASPFLELHTPAEAEVAGQLTLSDGATLLARLEAFAPGCTPPVVSPD